LVDDAVDEEEVLGVVEGGRERMGLAGPVVKYSRTKSVAERRKDHWQRVCCVCAWGRSPRSECMSVVLAV
jgi:hypothetical protein